MPEINLTQPIKAHGEEVARLDLREPTTEDIIACGYPLQIGNGIATPDAGAIARYIGRLANIPASSVKQLVPRDFNACMAAILPFFGDAAPSQGTESAV